MGQRNPADATEPELMRIMNIKYGVMENPRIEKLFEEIDELKEAALKLKEKSEERWKAILDPTVPMWEYDNVEMHYIDELADVLAIVTHLQHLSGYTRVSLLNIAKTKIKMREKDPNYHKNW